MMMHVRRWQVVRLVRPVMSGRAVLHDGDSREILKTLADNSIDSIVTDPPYALVSIAKRFGKTSLSGKTKIEQRARDSDDGFARTSRGFMGQTWDNGDAAHSIEFWAECLRVLKPGGFVLAFGGTRTYHRLACAIEDAGFEIRDMVQWLYGSGFPKSHDVSKGIDKAAGAVREVVGSRLADDIRGGNLMHRATSGESQKNRSIDITAPATEAANQWEGWGTALKPACEPICLARKPLSEKTVAANVLRWGTGALNIDGCRVDHVTIEGGNLALNPHLRDSINGGNGGNIFPTETERRTVTPHAQGRFPANVIHDGSDEVIAGFPNTSSPRINNPNERTKGRAGMFHAGDGVADYRDSGSAARFFYNAKASKKDRTGSKHPTVKPIKLLRYLCRLITPPGGAVLDPFAGSGTTGEAAYLEGFKSIMIEREASYAADIRVRMAALKVELLP